MVREMNMINTLILSAVIIGISIILCNYYQLSENLSSYGGLAPTQYLWRGGIPAANSGKNIEFNVMNPDGIEWNSPNMVGFDSMIGNIESSENANNNYGENYAPGDGNTDGYIAYLAGRYPNKPSGSENFEDRNVNNVLNSMSTYEENAAGQATRFYDSSKNSFRNKRFLPEYLENFIPSFSKGAAVQRSNIYFAESNNREEKYLSDIHRGYIEQLDRLMNRENQNHYLSNTDAKWSKEESIITPMRQPPLVLTPQISKILNTNSSAKASKQSNVESNGKPAIKNIGVPNSLTTDRDKTTMESMKEF